mmetsp:Transcript_28870/g.43591  ORF Transcript_28870/g.43591 Transcript_28870/m.43591 type:complete len:136 (-) Transcript_28870:40-447(-)
MQNIRPKTANIRIATVAGPRNCVRSKATWAASLKSSASTDGSVITEAKADEIKVFSMGDARDKDANVKVESGSIDILLRLSLRLVSEFNRGFITKPLVKLSWDSRSMAERETDFSKVILIIAVPKFLMWRLRSLE